jgi:hypothetical protein
MAEPLPSFKESSQIIPPIEEEEKFQIFLEYIPSFYPRTSKVEPSLHVATCELLNTEQIIFTFI